jgi:hypothetical protein
MKKNYGIGLFTQLIGCSFFVLYLCSAQPNEASNRLSRDLLKDYNKMIRGVKDTDETSTVYFEFSLIRIAEFDEVNGKLTLVGYFYVVWHDYRMEWDPEEYKDTQTILFEEKEVWKPLIILATAQEKFKTLGNENNFFIRFSRSGYAEWYPGDIWATSCTPDVYTFPYDTQTCVVTYVIWFYSIHEVTAKALSDKVNLHVYSPHGMWDLIDTSVTSNVDAGRGLTLINITLVMKRISTFHLINMVLPIVFVGLLNILVFLLPAQSGERVGYSITVLLAIAVFQTIASDNLPNVSKPHVSLLCIKLLADLILSALMMTLTIVTLYFYHMPESRKVPSCIAAVTRFVLCKNTCRNKEKDRDQLYITEHGIGKTESVLVNDCCSFQAEVTWTDVGKTSDIVFAVICLLTFLASNIVFLVFVVF